LRDGCIEGAPMRNVDEILESDEMKNVVSAVEALRRKFLPASSLKELDVNPVDMAYREKFPASDVLKLLLDEELYYEGFKKVLAVGFAGWVALPDDSSYRRILVIAAALEHMKSAAKAADRGDVLTLEQDIAARYVLTGPQFLIDVYDRIGGYSAFQIVPSVHDTWVRDSEIRAARSAAQAVCYLHHGVNRAQELGRQFAPSLNRAVAAFDALKERKDFPFEAHYVGRSLLHRRWSGHKETLALLYSASTIDVRQQTLLDVVLNGQFTYQSHRRYLGGWISRARYVAAYIFSRMADTKLTSDTNGVLGSGKMTQFAPKKLREIEEVAVMEQIERYIK